MLVIRPTHDRRPTGQKQQHNSSNVVVVQGASQTHCGRHRLHAAAMNAVGQVCHAAAHFTHYRNVVKCTNNFTD